MKKITGPGYHGEEADPLRPDADWGDLAECSLCGWLGTVADVEVGFQSGWDGTRVVLMCPACWGIGAPAGDGIDLDDLDDPTPGRSMRLEGGQP
jgi:hypothetical protein